MKKIVIVLVCGVLAIGSLSAQDEVTFPRNELKTNVLNDLLQIVNLNYERLLNDESGVGLSVAAFILEDVDANLTLAPYYRQYFGKKPAAGFFVEGGALLITFDNDGNGGGVTGGLSLAFGTKLISKKDIVVEAFLGISRLFVAGIFSDGGGGTLVYPRAGISVGKRF